ncbi:alpha/beta hydrolase [Azospirillum canadense]|uniref:alpha/beta hydrolase n=1 Tax=Azospirillum canadense TaxID=403962 RepID=UPI00222626FF|nr:alpha/beta hydrolase [Azospirillum canadense]MCW2237221.1 acetyl esterase/lipase [Azospirillum canadense]
MPKNAKSKSAKSKIILQGRTSHKYRSLATLALTTLRVMACRAAGRPLVPEWTIPFEIGNLFWRAQFNHAFALGNIAEGRAYFDSLVAVVDANPAVDIRPSRPGEPRGDWFIPHTRTGDATLLYFHGGGYSFYASVTRHFIAMLAHTLGLPIFAPDYRLTPEHPHPAQIEDALAAYRFLLDQGIDPARLVVCGDSAGGHLTLMTIAGLAEAGLPQPAIGIALSPWTDVGRRGASQFGNDRYDLVQGYMTLRFAEWLKGSGGFTDAELSPIARDFRGLAPLYLQAGGKEILVDMIRDFARTVQEQGARVRLEVWEHMTHEFQAHGQELPESREAFARLGEAIRWATEPAGRERGFPPGPRIEVETLCDD